jgi:spore maturation protein SpmA
MGILHAARVGCVSLLAIRLLTIVHGTFTSIALGGGRVLLNHIWALLIIVGIIVAGASVVYETSVVGEKTITTMVDGKKVEEVVKYTNSRDKAVAFAAAGNKLTKAAVNSVSFRYENDKGSESDGAVGLAISLIGIMALWLGLMKIAEEAGLIQALARAISPLFRIIFPSIPKGHPAAGAILMNLAGHQGDEGTAGTERRQGDGIQRHGDVSLHQRFEHHAAAGVHHWVSCGQ